MSPALARIAPRLRTLLASLVGLALARPVSGLACATCFGASDDKMAQGMNMGILALLVVVVGVLAGLLTAGIVIVQRARRCPDPEAEVSVHSETTGPSEDCR